MTFSLFLTLKKGGSTQGKVGSRQNARCMGNQAFKFQKKRRKGGDEEEEVSLQI